MSSKIMRMLQETSFAVRSCYVWKWLAPSIRVPLLREEFNITRIAHWLMHGLVVNIW